MAINFPSSPTNGQVYTDTTSGMTWVYSTTDTAWSGSFNRSNYVSQTFTATSGQTSFTVSGGYLPSLIEVYQNGVLLVNGTDVTVTSGTAVVLAVGATTNDIIQVIGISTFNVASFDASAITSGIIPVTRGGTGVSTITANSVVLGNGTSAVQTVAPGTNGNVLVSNGTIWTSAAPTSTGINVQTFTGSGTWTKPAGYSASSRVLIQAWGGGGSGAYRNPAGGGGGGGYNERWLTLSAMGATETVTIGAGGTAITTLNNNGNNGGNTTVGSLITAYGGGGGTSTGGGGGGGELSAGGAILPGLPWYTPNTAQSPVNIPSGQSQGSDRVITYNGYCAGSGLNSGGGGGVGNGSGGGPTPYSAAGHSLWGGGGGGGASFNGGPAIAGGTSQYGGNGGAGYNTGVCPAASAPGGGGGGCNSSGASGAGGAGQVIITVFPA